MAFFEGQLGPHEHEHLSKVDFLLREEHVFGIDLEQS
jgi:hypothetical protein